MIFILFLIAVVCDIIYNSLPSKYKKLEEKFGGFMNKRLVKFEMKSHHYILLFMVLLVRERPILLNNF